MAPTSPTRQLPAMPDSHWVAVTAPGARFPILEGLHETDVVVIGGGFTGLSTALHLREHGIAVTILEAVEPGFGASGRNNGQVIPALSHLDPDDMVAKYGVAGDRFADLVGQSASILFELVRKHDLKAEAEQTGWIEPAHTQGGLKIARRRVGQWAARGAPVEMLSRDDIVITTGSSRWHGGWWNRSGGHINPLALAREMARKVAGLGGCVFAHTPAIQYERRGGRWIVTTAQGSVGARALVLATHAYSDTFSTKLDRAVSREIIPVLSWQMATTPIPDSIRAMILPGRQAISDMHGNLHFMRYDQRHQLITGGALAVPFNQAGRLKSLIAARLKAIYPQIGDVIFSHVWNGLIAMTDDHSPRIHRIGHDAYAWAGCNGRGVALSIALGRELAGAVRGVACETLALPLTDVRPLPFHGVRCLLAPLLLMRDNRRNNKQI